MMLSPHFSLEELTFSVVAARKGIDNTPTLADVDRLQGLVVWVLEPMRELLGVPVVIDSGFRSPALNRAVGSTAALSDHLSGDAADCRYVGMDVRTAFDKIRASAIPYKQLIIECGTWIHISRDPEATVPKRENLIATGSAGHWTYSLA